MRYDAHNAPMAKVIDDATGQELRYVMWVDDATLEYSTHTMPVQIVGDEVVTVVVKVTRVHVDWAARVIHVNEPPRVIQAQEGHIERPCDECRQESTCRRISYCAQYRCAFGAVDKP